MARRHTTTASSRLNVSQRKRPPFEFANQSECISPQQVDCRPVARRDDRAHLRAGCASPQQLMSFINCALCKISPSSHTPL